MSRSKFVRQILVPIAFAIGAVVGHFLTTPAPVAKVAPPVERAWGPTIRVVGRVPATAVTIFGNDGLSLEPRRLPTKRERWRWRMRTPRPSSWPTRWVVSVAGKHSRVGSPCVLFRDGHGGHRLRVDG